jgi:hypothetical protein
MHSNRREGRCCVRWCDREVRCTRERLGATQSPPFGERSQAFLVARNPRKFGYHEQGIAEDQCGEKSRIHRKTSFGMWRLSLFDGGATMLCAFAARLWWRLDDGALVKTKSQNDHEQEDKNHYRHDDTSVS